MNPKNFPISLESTLAPVSCPRVIKPRSHSRIRSLTSCKVLA